MQDFEVIEIVTFPSGGTTQTPQHDHGDFVFQSYAPLAMRYFRDIFDISVEGFLNSIAAEPLGNIFKNEIYIALYYIRNNMLQNMIQTNMFDFFKNDLFEKFSKIPSQNDSALIQA